MRTAQPPDSAPAGALSGAGLNLTELEIIALPDAVNVSDGHARQDLTEPQREIIEGLSELFYEAVDSPVLDIEQRAHRAFFEAMGQSVAPVEEGRVLSCYASSVAMAILARSLAGRIQSLGLIHPTFDNIPDILKGAGLHLRPVDEQTLAHGEAEDVVPAGECLFLTTPNNPTGRVVEAERLAFLARECARRRSILVLDTSFRGFDVRAQYDHYEILDQSGAEYVVIEDTGKLWPTLDVKIGLLVVSRNLDLPIRKVYTDILLGVSPFVLALMERFSTDAGTGGLGALHRQIEERRLAVRSILQDVDAIRFPDSDSRVSVERLELRAPHTATDLWRTLRGRHVHALPCGPFHWARPAEGDRFLRIALARPLRVVTTAATALRDALV